MERVKRVKELVRNLDGEVLGDVEIPIRGIAHHSRKVGEGHLFAAIKGEKRDGLDFLPEAYDRGAVAVLVDRPVGIPFPCIIKVKDVRRALGQVAQRFYHNPSAQMSILAITGTKGKTTTSYLIASILNAAGKKTGIVGTLGGTLNGEVWHLENTTPEADDLVWLLRQYQTRGAQCACFEASSHGLRLGKLSGIVLDRALFTNLSQDHLDFHMDMEDYFSAKKLLFTEVERKRGFQGLVNADDSYGIRLLQEVPGLLGYGIKNGEYRAESVELGEDGSRLQVRGLDGKGLEVFTPLRGEHNVYNVVGAVALGLSLGIPPGAIQEGIARVRGIPGRMEEIQQGQPFSVLVDFAHTPDSLLKVLTAVRRLTTGRVITVFGCGGNRDRAKRPRMGRIACEFSDLVFITSDNPRQEDPLEIIREILGGIPVEQASRIRIFPDRREAIRKAIAEAKKMDVVVIAGKGHETYQILGDSILPFDDRVEARRALQELGYEG